MRRAIAYALGMAVAFATAAPIVSAHEVYVLEHDEVQAALQAPPFDVLGIASRHIGELAGWGAFFTLILAGAFLLSINRRFAALAAPFLARLKPIAPRAAQLTIGIALFASGWYGAVFGPEMPTALLFHSGRAMDIGFMVMGGMLALGIYPRLAAMAAVGLFLALVADRGIYVLNYGTYLGEALAVALFGGAYVLRHRVLPVPMLLHRLEAAFHEYKFLLLRVFFGSSLIFASLYAKFIHGGLALETVYKYELTQYFPFAPDFLVLGAMMTEILVGALYISGILVRLASVILLTFLTMSLFFFGEAVWPHIILIGTAVAMFLHGYDRYTLSVLIGRGRVEEPTL